MNTRIFNQDSIIQLPDGMVVVVDKEAEIIDWYYFPKENSIRKSTGKFENNGVNKVRPEWTIAIIATIYKRIKGVPLIQLPKSVTDNQFALDIIKEELEKSGVRKCLNINEFGYSQIERNIVNRIVEAASKEYSEEDIRNAMKDAFNRTGSFKQFERYIDSYLQRLQNKLPLPSMIELEVEKVVDQQARTEAINNKKEGENAWQIEYIDQIKIIPDEEGGTIIPTKIEYNEQS